MERQRPKYRQNNVFTRTLGTCKPGDVVDLHVNDNKNSRSKGEVIENAVVVSINESRQPGNPAVTVDLPESAEHYSHRSFGGGTAASVRLNRASWLDE